MRSLEGRVWALERPGSGACLTCELIELNRRVEGLTVDPQPCRHSPHRTLADELRSIDGVIEGERR